MDVFLGGAGGEEKAPGHGQQGRSMNDVRFQTAPFCYILYVEQWGFRCSMPSGHREGGPRSSMPWAAHLLCAGFDNPSTCSTHEDSQGSVAPRSTTDSTEQWVRCLCTCGLCCYMLCVYYMYMCYMIYVYYMSSAGGGSRVRLYII